MGWTFKKESTYMKATWRLLPPKGCSLRTYTTDDFKSLLNLINSSLKKGNVYSIGHDTGDKSWFANISNCNESTVIEEAIVKLDQLLPNGWANAR